MLKTRLVVFANAYIRYWLHDQSRWLIRPDVFSNITDIKNIKNNPFILFFSRLFVILQKYLI